MFFVCTFHFGSAGPGGRRPAYPRDGQESSGRRPATRVGSKVTPSPPAGPTLLRHDPNSCPDVFHSMGLCVTAAQVERALEVLGEVLAERPAAVAPGLEVRET